MQSTVFAGYAFKLTTVAWFVEVTRLDLFPLLF